MIKKLYTRILSFFRKKKISKQLDAINKDLENSLKQRALKKNEAHMKILTYARKRIRVNQSRYISPKKVSRTRLLMECQTKFKEELKNSEAVLTSDFKVKYKIVK